MSKNLLTRYVKFNIGDVGRSLLIKCILEGDVNHKNIEAITSHPAYYRSELEIIFNVNGVDIDVVPFFNMITEQLDVMVKEAALSILEDKCYDITQKLENASNLINEEIPNLLYNVLGIERDDD